MVICLNFSHSYNLAFYSQADLQPAPNVVIKPIKNRYFKYVYFCIFHIISQCNLITLTLLWGHKQVSTCLLLEMFTTFSSSSVQSIGAPRPQHIVYVHCNLFSVLHTYRRWAKCSENRINSIHYEVQTSSMQFQTCG